MSLENSILFQVFRPFTILYIIPLTCSSYFFFQIQYPSTKQRTLAETWPQKSTLTSLAWRLLLHWETQSVLFSVLNSRVNSFKEWGDAPFSSQDDSDYLHVVSYTWNDNIWLLSGWKYIWPDWYCINYSKTEIGKYSLLICLRLTDQPMQLLCSFISRTL